MRRSLAGTAALLLTVSVTSACTLGGSEATQTPSSSPSATSSPAAAAETPMPTASTPEVPAGLPVMPGAVAEDPAGEPRLMARWTVDAIGPDVYAYYLDALPAAGFVIDQGLPGGNVAVIRFTTLQGTALELTLVGESGGVRTRIGLRLPEGP